MLFHHGLFMGIYHGGEVTLIVGWVLLCVCLFSGFGFGFFCQEVINAFHGIKIFPACLNC